MIKTKFNLFSLGTLFCICLSNTQMVRSQPLQIPATFADSVAWTNETWNDNDSRFKAIEMEVDKRLRNTTKPLNVVYAYRSVAAGDLSNASNVYRWAYAAHELARHAKTRQQLLDLQKGVYAALLRPVEPRYYLLEPYYKDVPDNKLPPPPHSYRYTRMLFLAAIASRVPSVMTRDKFLALSSRLLRKRPSDDQVKFARVELLNHLRPISAHESPIWAKRSEKGVEDGRRMALKYSLEFVSQNPKSMPALAQLADVYYWMWDGKNNYGNLSIATYRKYLAMAPKSDSYRGSVLRRLAEIEKSKRFYEQRGNR